MGKKNKSKILLTVEDLWVCTLVTGGHCSTLYNDHLVPLDKTPFELARLYKLFIYTNSHKRQAPLVADTFHASRGCPITCIGASTVYYHYTNCTCKIKSATW